MITGRRADRFSAVVRRTLKGLAAVDDAELDDGSFLNELARKLAEAVDAERVGVGILEGGALRMRGSHGFPLEVVEGVVVPVSPGGAGLADRVTFGGLVYAGNLRDDPGLEAYRDVIDLLNVRSVAGLGWRAGSEVIGVLMAFDSRRPDGFSGDDILLLELVGDFSGYMYRERVSRRRGEMLLRLSDGLSRLGDFDAMAVAVADAARRMLPGIECGIVEVSRSRPETLRALAFPAGLERAIPADADLAGTGAARVIASGRPLETDDLSGSSVQGETLLAAGFRRVRSLPISVGAALPDGRPALGVITFLGRSRQPFTADERWLMDDLARRLGLFAHRAELQKQEADASAALRTALEAALDISSSLEPSEVINRLLQRATEALAADRATLSTIEGEDLVIAGSFAADGPAFEAGTRFRYSTSPQFLEVMRTRQPLRDTYRLEDIEPEVRQAMAGLQHSVTVPIVESEKVVATVTVSRRSDHPFTAGDGSLLAIVASAAGMALHKARVFEETQRLLHEAREVSRAKSDFLNLAGHELRTPLAVIRGYLSLVTTGAYGEPPSEWTPVLSLLDTKSRELAMMVDSILVAARLESGRLLLGTEAIDISEIVSQAVERASAAAALVGGAVVGRYPNRAVTVSGDPTQLAVIVDNLLANAVKYSPPPAAVTATVGVRQGYAEVRVADRGVGIARGDWDRIFEEFSRVENFAGDYPAGTGLGLYIARQMAERYGGTLVIEASEPGQGSTFLLRLPLTTAE